MKIIIYIFSICLIFVSCYRLDFDEDIEVPIVKLFEAIDIDETGVTFEAYVYHLGSNKIVRSYFNWFPTSVNHCFGEEFFQIDVEIKENQPLSARINKNLIEGIQYSGRFVVELKNKTITSNFINFSSEGSEEMYYNYKETDETWYSSDTETFVAFNKFCVRENNTIFTYVPNENKWLKIEDGLEGLTSRNIIYSDENELFVTGRATYSSAEENGLWKLNSFGGDYVRLGDLPFLGRDHKLGFRIDDDFYSANVEKELMKFNLREYNGATVLSELPFEFNPHPWEYQYLACAVKKEGYVLILKNSISDYKNSTENQLWEYSPEDNSWILQSYYPGTIGGHFFMISDGSRYIYAGSGNSDKEESDGDFWRYDTLNDKWQHLGWIPNYSTLIKSPFVSIIDRKIYLITSESTVIVIDLDEI